MRVGQVQQVLPHQLEFRIRQVVPLFEADVVLATWVANRKCKAKFNVFVGGMDICHILQIYHIILDPHIRLHQTTSSFFVVFLVQLP